MAINFPEGTQNLPAIYRSSAVNASGSSTVNILNIPGDAKKVCIWLYEMNHPSGFGLVRIGDAGGIETTGYDGQSSYVHSNNNTTHNTSGIPYWSSGNEAVSGCITLENQPGTNLWSFSGCGADPQSHIWVCGGRKGLSGTLDRIQVLNTNSSNFSGGQVWITYEN